MKRGGHCFKQFCNIIVPLSVSNIAEEAFKEWECDTTFYLEHSTNCICGVDILYNYMIINKLNGNIIPSIETKNLPIGSTCIKKFLPIDEGRKCQELENRMKVKKEKQRVQLEEPEKLCCFCNKYHKRRTDVKLGRICKKCETLIDGYTLYFDILPKDKEQAKGLSLWYDKKLKMWNSPHFRIIQKVCFNVELLQDLPLVFYEGKLISFRRFSRLQRNSTF